MSTSPSRACAVHSASTLDPQPFPYDAVPARNRTTLLENTIPVGDNSAPSTRDVDRESQARSQGHAEGLAEARKNYEGQLAKERSSLSAALAQFRSDRAVYFQKIEGEVVQLALSIARKILHREAQLDPLLLAGIVRVALEKIEGATGVVLRVHPHNSAEWRRFLATHLEPADLPEIVDDPSQPPDSCQLETAMGTAAFGLDIQLKEIGQGLMDVLAARPGVGT